MDQNKPQRPRKSIPLSLEPVIKPYSEETRFLVMPSDLSGSVRPCKAVVSSATQDGAWLAGIEEEGSFPEEEEILMVEFQGQDVLTHQARILERNGHRVRVGAPTFTERERSQLAPFTGRFDYRVEVNLPVQVRICQGRAQSHQQWPCQLHDLSRGGMSLIGPATQPFEKGQKVDVRVISWEYPVRIETEITRVWREKGQEVQRTAMSFPEEMSLLQRELISTFILQVQRRDALGRSLPAEENTV